MVINMFLTFCFNSQGESLPDTVNTKDDVNQSEIVQGEVRKL